MDKPEFSPTHPSTSRSAAHLEVSDRHAIRDVIHGNREMFEVLVRRYNTRLYRVGMAYLRAHALAEDAMQNAYVKAFLNLGRFNRASSFGTWLTRIMINECLMILRGRKARAAEPFDEIPEAYADLPDPSATRDQLHWKEMKALLERAIGTLPDTCRAVYILRDVQQLTTRETAECLGMSTDSVKVNLHRARDRLKTTLLNSAAGAEVFSYEAVHCDPMTERVLHAIQRAQPGPDDRAR